MIDWTTTTEEADLILKIAKKAKEQFSEELKTIPLMTLDMDLTATHNMNGKLRLQEMLDEDGYDFAHDIFGIINNMNRETGKLENFFEPRFTDYDLKLSE